MNYHIDTNILIYILKGTSEALMDRLMSHAPQNIKVSSLVKAELLYGVEKSSRKKENLVKVLNLLAPFEIIPFDDRAAEEYALIRCETEKKGCIVGPNDLIIASVARSRNDILVTNNIKEFGRISNLKLENWLTMPEG